MKLGSTSLYILIVGFLATVLVSYLTFDAAQSAADRSRGMTADALVNQISQRMERVDIKLRALRALFSVDRAVSDSEFEEFAEALSQPDYVKALQFVRIVDGEKIDSYAAVQRSIRKYPFQLTQRTGASDTKPAEPGSKHYIVEFIYPYAGNEKALGLDVNSNPASVEAIDRAITTKSIVSTDSFYLVQNPTERAFLVYLPVDSHRLQEQTVQIAGAAGALISLPELSAALQTETARLGRLTVKDSGQELFLTDQADGDWVETERDVNVVNRQWVVTVLTPASQTPQNLALLVFGFGSVLTLLALGAFEQTRLQQERQIVARLLNESEHSRTFVDAIYQSLFESAGTANLEIEVSTGRVLRANSQLVELLKDTEAGIIGEPLEQLFAPESLPRISSALAKLGETGSSSKPIQAKLATPGTAEVWTLLSIGNPVANAGGGQTATVVMQDISAAKEYQRSRDVLVRELAHRVRNTMQLIGSLADQTALRSATVEAYRKNLKSRLHALSSAQDALFDANWGDLRLDALLEQVLRPFADDTNRSKFSIDVEPVMVSAQEAQMIALAVHELGNNAAKYGALAQPGGRVELQISKETEANGQNAASSVLHIMWRESGVKIEDGKPERNGFGTIMLDKLLPRQFSGTSKTSWTSDGLLFDARLPLRAQEGEQ
jgi:two-component sensor histidine kinase/CHASE1-domain containing sensor protein